MSEKMSAREPKQDLPFWPHYILSETIAWYTMLGVLIILAAFFPAGLEDKADPFKTPEHVKPEWYFLAVYQFLKVASVLTRFALEVTATFSPALLHERTSSTAPGKASSREDTSSR